MTEPDNYPRCPQGHSIWHDKVGTFNEGTEQFPEPKLKVWCQVCIAEEYPALILDPKTGDALLLWPGWRDPASDQRRYPKTHHRVAVAA